MTDSMTLKETIFALELRLHKVEKELSDLKYHLGQASEVGDVDEDSEPSRDELFTEAVKLFSQYERASSSLIQRKLSIGYARAARILDQLYEAGLVGSDNGGKPRTVMTAKILTYLSNYQNDATQ